MLTIRNLTKTYPNGTEALANISLDFQRGEIVALVGGSGCGKSTLLRLVAGLDRPTGGEVAIDGEPVTAPHPAIGIVFQEPRLLPWLTNAENVGFGLADRPKKERDARVTEALARVRLSEAGPRWPKELSGGQAQRIAIARALVPRPSVLLLDEPFSALDTFTRARLHEHLLDLWQADRPTLVLVTHDLDEALTLADRIVVMRPSPGRIAARFAIRLDRPRQRGTPAFETERRLIAEALEATLVSERLAS